MSILRTATLAASVLAFSAIGIGQTTSARANQWGFGINVYGPAGGYGYGYRGYAPPVYRRNYAPIYGGFHYDQVYHPEYYHWTPDAGYHSHGHYDLVPHSGPHYGGYGHGYGRHDGRYGW